MFIRYKDPLLFLVYSLITSYSLILKLYEIITTLPTLDSYWGLITHILFITDIMLYAFDIVDF